MYNPRGLRLGNKVLRQRLKGPPLAAYYPRKVPGASDLNKIFGHQLYAWDEEAESHLEHLEGYALLARLRLLLWENADRHGHGQTQGERQGTAEEKDATKCRYGNVLHLLCLFGWHMLTPDL